MNNNSWIINPANPASPVSPLNPANPASPLNPINQDNSPAPQHTQSHLAQPTSGTTHHNPQQGSFNFDIAFIILFFGLMAVMWATTRPVRCPACRQKAYGAHFSCPAGGKDFLVK